MLRTLRKLAPSRACHVGQSIWDTASTSTANGPAVQAAALLLHPCFASPQHAVPGVVQCPTTRTHSSVAEPDPSALQEGSSDPGLTQDQVEFRGVAESFAKEQLLPFAAQWDEQKHFPVDVLKAAAELGFAGVYVSDEVGGSGLGRADAAVIFEALAYGDVSTTAFLSIHNMVSYMIDRFGSPAQRQLYLPRLCSMDLLGSYCLTEPSAGSDAASLRASARRDGQEYVLSGQKQFISGAGVSDVYIVMARTGQPGPKGISAFIVEKDMPGVSFGKQEAKLGWNSQPTAVVMLDGVRVPEANLLGKEGGGFGIAMNGLDGGRINIATCSVGGAQYCLDYAWEYGLQRKQFGRPVGDFQASQFKLADMATQVQASRLMVRHAARSLDCGSASATMDAAMAKRFATDACYAVTNDALQLLGGYGFLRDYPVERYMRDLRVHSILEGTNEIMRVIIHRELNKAYAGDV